MQLSSSAVATTAYLRKKSAATGLAKVVPALRAHIFPLGGAADQPLSRFWAGGRPSSYLSTKRARRPRAVVVSPDGVAGLPSSTSSTISRVASLTSSSFAEAVESSPAKSSMQKMHPAKFPANLELHPQIRQAVASMLMSWCSDDKTSSMLASFTQAHGNVRFCCMALSIMALG